MSDRPIRLLSGKGGVGKTTLAAATALLAARQGHRTLLVSTDPAHSAGDVLEARLGDRPREVGERLWAVEIDPEASARAHVRRIAAELPASVDPDLLPTVRRHLDLAADSPGTMESALFDRLADLLEAVPGDYDRLVVDTAPTGHTLRLLALPALLDVWAQGLARQRERVAGMDRMLRNLAGTADEGEADPVLTRLRDRRARFARARQRLDDDAAVLLVAVPERLVIEETVRARDALRDGGLRVEAVLVNRVLPAEADGRFLAARREQQASYLADLAARLGEHPIVEVPQRPRDIAGRADLDAIVDALARSPATA